MKIKYSIEGMTCQSCVHRVKQGLESLPKVEVANVSLSDHSATLRLQDKVSITELQNAIGKYKISPYTDSQNRIEEEEALIPTASAATYKPLIIIIAYLILVSLLAQYPYEGFDVMRWMRHFMAGFFLTFSFFKIINLDGFVESYRRYDIPAAYWRPWGYIYPFVELGLGISYFIGWMPVLTNVLTIIVLGVSSIGVIRSVLSSQEIKCACLGDVFNLPMSTVTVIEDVSMVVMAALMLVL